MNRRLSSRRHIEILNLRTTTLTCDTCRARCQQNCTETERQETAENERDQRNRRDAGEVRRSLAPRYIIFNPPAALCYHA